MDWFRRKSKKKKKERVVRGRSVSVDGTSAGQLSLITASSDGAVVLRSTGKSRGSTTRKTKTDYNVFSLLRKKSTKKRFSMSVQTIPRFDPPKDMLENMTSKFTSRKDRGTVWIDLPRLCHKISIIDMRSVESSDTTIHSAAAVDEEKVDCESSSPSLFATPPPVDFSGGRVLVSPETWHQFEHTSYFDEHSADDVVDDTGALSLKPTVTEETKSGEREGDEEKKEHSLEVSVNDTETAEEQCVRMWRHWEVVCEFLRQLTAVCDGMTADSSSSTTAKTVLSEALEAEMSRVTSHLKERVKFMADADLPKCLMQMFDNSQPLSDSLLLSILCLCTQRIVYEPVFRISHEILKEHKMSDYRGKGSWFIDIIFHSLDRVQIRHRRRGAVKEDPRDTSKWAVVSWEVDMLVSVDSEHLADSRCTNRRIRLTGIEFHDDATYEFKRKWRHKLCGGTMTLL